MVTWWPCPSDWHDWGSQQSKTPFTSNLTNSLAVFSTLFLTDRGGKSLVECGGSSTHTSYNWHDKWSESCVFNFSYQVQKSYYFFGHYCLEHSKQFSDKYHSVITRSFCLSIVYKLTVTWNSCKASKVLNQYRKVLYFKQKIFHMNWF